MTTSKIKRLRRRQRRKRKVPYLRSRLADTKDRHRR